MRPRRRASLALAAFLLFSGCLGGGFGPGTGPATSPATTAAGPATATTADPTGTATRSSCSLDSNVTLSNVSEPGNLSADTAGSVAEAIESQYQSVRVEEHSYFNHHVRVESVERVEGDYRVVISGELDYDHREDGTVTHVHRPYTVTYLVTDRQVVRRGEAGVTGTVACW